MPCDSQIGSEVWVRYVRTQEFESPEAATRARATLDHAEWQTLVRLRERTAQLHFLAGRSLARTMLAEVMGQSPRGIQIRTSAAGGLELIAEGDGARPRFSISHADGIALCVVSLGCRVGADVETLRHRPRDPMDLAGNICSDAECADLLEMPREDRARQVLTIWSLKVAVAKATGLGLRLPMARITVISRHDAPAMAIDGTPALRWRLLTWRVTPRHLASVAVRPADPREVVFRFQRATSSGSVTGKRVEPQGVLHPSA